MLGSPQFPGDAQGVFVHLSPCRARRGQPGASGPHLEGCWGSPLVGVGDIRHLLQQALFTAPPRTDFSTWRGMVARDGEGCRKRGQALATGRNGTGPPKQLRI